MVIHKRLLEGLLIELHSAYMSAAYIKNLERCYFWLQNLGRNIEQLTDVHCTLCVKARPDPPSAKLIEWPENVGVFYKMHIDLLSPIYR